MSDYTPTEWLAMALWPTLALDREMTWRFAAERLAGAATALEMYSEPRGLNVLRDLVLVCLARAEDCMKEELRRRLDLGRSIINDNVLMRGPYES